MNTDGAQKLWQCFETLEIRPDGCPAWFATAVPTIGLSLELPNFPMAATPARGRIANGRGITREACLRSCRGELIELASCCSWGDESLISATLRDLGSKAIPAGELTGLGPQQYADRLKWNEEYGWFDWRPRQHDPVSRIDWVEVEDAFTGRTKLVPADAVLIGRREPGDEAAVVIADSNGCASHESMEEAKRSALLELIERDAMGRWWYGGHHATTLDLSTLCKSRSLTHYLLSRSRCCKLIDMTTDISVSAVAAITFEPDGRDVAIGSAASPDPHGAVESALLEALQMEIALDTARMAEDISQSWAVWRRTVTMETHPLCSIDRNIRDPRCQSAPDNLQTCLAACLEAGAKVYWKELTRKELGIPSVRVLSPGLCHFKPRFGSKRLLQSEQSVPNSTLLLV